MEKGSGPFANAELCTQCGYCLPVCPTYRVENNELHAPRGRISVILALQSGTLTIGEAAAALDHCLLCRACHTACPAGVRPAKLALLLRTLIPPRPTVWNRLLHHVTNSHRLTAHLAALLRLYQKSGVQRVVRRRRLLRLLPPLARMEALIPRHRMEAPPFPPFPAHSGLPGLPRIGLLCGCMARLFFPGVAPSAAQLLALWGVEVCLLEGFGCCGAPFREAGDRKGFLHRARRTLDAFLAAGPLQAVVCDSSVCAVTARRYARALADDATYAAAARDFSAKVQPLSPFLVKGVGKPTVLPKNPGFGHITYHDHCQARHGLGIMQDPRGLLTALPVVYHELWPPDETVPDGCCGAGGDYQLRHPVRSQKIREQKLAAIHACGAEVVVGENPGCLLHIAAGLEKTGSAVQVRHLAEILYAAYSLQQPTHKVPP